MAKTTIRNPALEWFNGKFPSVTEPVVTSKFYTSEKSWSKTRVWFFQVPLNIIEPNKIKYIHFVCENNLSGEPFLYLKVPTLFLLRNESKFEVDRKAKVMRLYLSAESFDMFKEIRRNSNIDFKSFLQTEQVV